LIESSPLRESRERSWKPRGVWAWLLTVISVLLAALMVTVAFCMLVTVPWRALALLGSGARFFPLHLLFFTLIAMGLEFAAARSRASLAAWLSGLTALLTIAMALIPVGLTWQRSRQLNVPLSLGTYLANGMHMNSGHPQTDRTVSYGMAKDGSKLELDVWGTGLPHSGPLRPAVVFVHGGGWTHGTRSMLPEWDRWLNQLGYEVFDVEYRMPPPVRWQDEVGDVKAALGWVAVHAAEYYVDPARISIMGNSAGGNLSMLAAYAVGDPLLPASTDVPEVAVRSVVNLYGPPDAALLYRSTPSYNYVRGVMTQYIGGSPDEFPERYRALSPLSHIGARTPPTLMLLGTSDQIVPTDQSSALQQALSAVGIAHEIYLLPANDHGFDLNWGGFGTQIARSKIEDFLKRHG
jgi:acetyl esterase/lipase